MKKPPLATNDIPQDEIMDYFTRMVVESNKIYMIDDSEPSSAISEDLVITD